MIKSKLMLVIFVLLIQNSIQMSTSQITDSNRLILLYKKNADQSIYMIDKLNKLSTLDGSLNLNRIQTINKNSDSQQTPEQLTVLNLNHNHMLVGSINKAFNVSLENFNDQSVQNKEILTSVEYHKQLVECGQKQNAYECSNYIKVGIEIKKNDKSVLITCGTNMNKPFCRKQHLNNSSQPELELNQNRVPIRSNNFLIPQFLQVPKSFQINTQNIPAFDFSEAIYFFHSQLPSQDIYKQKYEFVDNDIQFNELIKTPIGAIKSKIN